MKKILFLLAIGIFPMACSYKGDVLKETLLNDEFWYTGGILFPVKVALWGELKEDTICIVTTSYSLWNSINIRGLIKSDDFPYLLYNIMEETNGYLNVNKQLFLELQKSKIERVPEVDSIYNSTGINGILSHYLKSTGELLNMTNIENYIIYLCYQHNIYFRLFEDETGPRIFIVKKR